MTVDEMHALEAYRRTRYFRKLGRDFIAVSLTLAVLTILGLWVAG